MNDKTAYEIERKYLIEYPDIAALERLASRKIEMVQTYLIPNDGKKMRIRSCLENGKYTYVKTVKKTVTALRRLETEGEMTETEYLALLNSDIPKRQLTKTRYCVNYKNQCFEVDIYPFWADRAIMEIELSHESDKIEFPEFITIKKEVSEEKTYRNFSLAKQI